ncbi:ATP-binding protein [Olivibacter domesticus]|uniref:Oxygen sensor histidine kinase NreB n=1 Tax=Olivibacter domesticus TaxID=407022 RepID=A0A1H7UDV3_OLID1|nr:ATP-binding protein [Olivibacter domesticus]SEL94875.1 Tetratricopeptide repeat-containing protein [Olivibacter domesticus]
MKTYTFILLYFVGLCCAKAQMMIKLADDTAYINSLNKKFSAATTDSAKAQAAFLLSQINKRAKNVENAKHYLDEGIALSKGNGFLKAASYYYQAFSMLGTSDIGLVERNLRKSDSLLAQIKNNREAFKVRSNVWILLGVLEQMKGNEKGGLDAYINQALPLAKKTNDLFLMANANKFVGISLLNAKQREKADKYLHEALQLFEKSEPEGLYRKPESIIEVALVVAENNIYLNKPAVVTLQLKKVRDILKNYPQSNAHIQYYYCEGLYYDYLKKYGEAVASFDKGVAFASDNTENYFVNRLKFFKFESLRKKQDYHAAINVMQHLLESKILMPLDRQLYYRQLAMTYAGAGKPREAYEWSQKYIDLADTLNEAKYKTDIHELEKKYQTAEKEKEIMTLTAKKRESDFSVHTAKLHSLLWSAACLFLLLLVGFLFYYLRHNKKLSEQKEINHRQQLREMEQQQQLQLSKAMLEGEERERKRIARDLHDGLGGALAGIRFKLSGQLMEDGFPVMEETIVQLDASIGELRRIARNMMPESLLRSGLKTALADLCNALTTKMTYVVLEVDGIQRNMDEMVQVNIYRIVQELLNNAIRHGMASHIIVQCLQNGNLFLITVEDNGKGFDPYNTDGEGIGLSNIRNRVEYMNGNIKIDSAENQGTTVHVELFL